MTTRWPERQQGKPDCVYHFRDQCPPSLPIYSWFEGVVGSFGSHPSRRGRINITPTACRPQRLAARVVFMHVYHGKLRKPRKGKKHYKATNRVEIDHLFRASVVLLDEEILGSSHVQVTQRHECARLFVRLEGEAGRATGGVSTATDPFSTSKTENTPKREPTLTNEHGERRGSEHQR